MEHEHKMSKLKSIIVFILVTLAVSLALFYLTLTGFGWGNWLFVIVNVIFFGLFLALLQFRRKVARLPASIYLAFVVAFYAEMYGFPDRKSTRLNSSHGYIS